MLASLRTNTISVADSTHDDFLSIPRGEENSIYPSAHTDLVSLLPLVWA